MLNVIIAGVGGQGTVLASKIISTAAVMRGLNVRSSETIGMAQRGGSVTSHLRISDTDIVCSPLIKKGGADVIIAFEPSEGVRNLPYLRKGGVMIVSTEIMRPITKYDYDREALIGFLKEHTGSLKIVDPKPVCESCGSYRTLNMVLIGAAADSLKLDGLADAVGRVVKPAYIEMNLKALNGGMKL